MTAQMYISLLDVYGRQLTMSQFVKIERQAAISLNLWNFDSLKAIQSNPILLKFDLGSILQNFLATMSG